MRSSPRFTVAITGMNARADNPGPGLAVARCLRESDLLDLRYIGLSYDALDPGLYHPYCDATYLIPYPSSGRQALKDRLLAIHEAEHIDAIIPCLDAELPNFVALEPELTSLGIKLHLPTEEQLHARDKSRLPELAKKAGVPYPEIRSITNVGFFDKCKNEGWDYPFVVKGPFYDAYIVRDEQSAITAFKKISSVWGIPLIAQRLVDGEEYNLTAVGDGEGKLLGTVMMKKRGLTEKGKAWAGICVFDQALQNMADDLARALRWRGPLEVEAMRSKEDGKYHLIEINPRFPAWIYLSAGVGRNLPALLISMMFGTERPPLPEPSIGTFFIKYAQEVILSVQGFETMMIRGDYTPSGTPAL